MIINHVFPVTLALLSSHCEAAASALLHVNVSATTPQQPSVCRGMSPSGFIHIPTSLQHLNLSYMSEHYTPLMMHLGRLLRLRHLDLTGNETMSTGAPNLLPWQHSRAAEPKLHGQRACTRSVSNSCTEASLLPDTAYQPSSCQVDHSYSSHPLATAARATLTAPLMRTPSAKACSSVTAARRSRPSQPRPSHIRHAAPSSTSSNPSRHRLPQHHSTAACARSRRAHTPHRPPPHRSVAHPLVPVSATPLAWSNPSACAQP